MVSLFMLGHVPRAEQAPLLGSIASWLREGGYLLATMGTADADDEVDENWLGAPMFFASFDEAADRRLLADAGFALIEARVIPRRGARPRSRLVHVDPRAEVLATVAAALPRRGDDQIARRTRGAGGKGSPAVLL